MPNGPQIILTLKVLVVAVTLLLLASLVALLLKRPRLHGHINTVFFVLTMATVAGFERSSSGWTCRRPSTMRRVSASHAPVVLGAVGIALARDDRQRQDAAEAVAPRARRRVPAPVDRYRDHRPGPSELSRA